MMLIVDHFDQLLDMKQDAGWHAMPDLKDDFNLVLNEEQIFMKKQGRKHSSFSNFLSDPFKSLKKDPKKLQLWLIKGRKAAVLEQEMSNQFMNFG